MANSTITLEFKGDTSDLDSAVKNVGSSADTMGKSMKSAGDDIGRAGDRTQGFIDKADKAEQRSMGFRDTITGVSDTLKGLNDDSLSTEERLLTLGMGVGDLASGFANYLIPAIAGAAAFLKGPLLSAMSFVAAHPLILVIGLLVAIIVLLIFNVGGLRDKIVEFAKVAWDWIKSKVIAAWDWVVAKVTEVIDWFKALPGKVAEAVSKAKQWIQDRFREAADWVKGKWNDVLNWFSSLPGKIGGFFSRIGDGIKNAFRTAFNWVASIWNNTIGRLNFTVPDWIPVIGGMHFAAPRIPTFHDGGIVPGARGSETLALLQAGERVIPAGRANSGTGNGTGVTQVIFSGNMDSAFATAFMRLVRSGEIQVVTT